MPGLPQCLVGDATGIDDGDIRVERLGVTVYKQPLTHLLRIGLRHLAPEKPDREGRHGAGCYSRA